MSEDSEMVDDPHLATSTSKPGSSGLHGLFKAFRSRNSDKYPDLREAGMEQHLINKIERMNFKEQMEMFYTAYSKVRTHEMVCPCWAKWPLLTEHLRVSSSSWSAMTL